MAVPSSRSQRFAVETTRAENEPEGFVSGTVLGLSRAWLERLSVVMVERIGWIMPFTSRAEAGNSTRSTACS